MAENNQNCESNDNTLAKEAMEIDEKTKAILLDKNKTLPLFSCILCDEQYWNIENVEEHMSSFHHISCKVRSKSLAMKSKNQ